MGLNGFRWALIGLEKSDDLILDVYFPQFAQFLLSNNGSSVFAQLCAQGQWQVDAQHPLEAKLCTQFGLTKQLDWPLAPIRLMGEGVAVQAGYWFLVHPVHFVLQRDFFTLGEALHLTAETTQTLIGYLNQHFSQDGLRFLPSDAGDCWYLHVADEVDVSTYSLAEALGRDVGKVMPYGKHGMRFQALLNEVQMLLHEHPLNQVREQQGLPAVNSIWLSGGGSLQRISPPPSKPKFKFFAHDSLSLGLAKWAGLSCHTELVDDSTFKHQQNGEHAVVVMSTQDVSASACFSVLLQALKRTKLKTLRCHFDVHGMTFTLTLKALDAWKFWRKRRPVQTYFHLDKP